MKISSIACVASMALISISLAGGDGWATDYSAAKNDAAANNKDLLIDFTGSDWCGWCIKLNDEVFKHDAFREGVKDSFQLVEIDFPRDKSNQSEEVQKQNSELGEKFGIQGYPTIVLADSEGRPYAMTGYQAGGPENYVDHLNELRKRKASRDEGVMKAAKLEGPEKAKALVEVIEAMELEPTLVSTHYPEWLEEIRNSDPDDSTEFNKRINNQQRLEAFQQKLQELASNNDMSGAMALVDETLEDGGFAEQETLQLMMTRALIFAQQDKFDEALKAIDDAKAFAPENPMIENINQFRQSLEQAKAQRQNAPEEEPAAESEQ